jgi:hypothetical protein
MEKQFHGLFYSMIDSHTKIIRFIPYNRGVAFSHTSA